ncbi:pilus assembly protein N-terminal domain-containing protein [Stenotrophomonas sp. STM01]|nr:pilus assembly protein N-terminal domain-containing protein [Stenotrophomonas sp. STM01]
MLGAFIAISLPCAVGAQQVDMMSGSTPSAPQAPQQMPILVQPAAATPAAPASNAGAGSLVPGHQFPAPVANAAYSRPAGSRQTVPLPERARLYVGQAAVYRLPRALKRVAVGNGEMLQVTNIGRNELVVIGNKTGDSTIHLWMQDGSQIEVPVTVGESDAEGLADTVRTLLADAGNITVHTISDRVVVTGQDVHPGIAARIASLKEIYPQLLDFTSSDPVGMRPMVLMDVKIMEFDSNALEELGIKWDNVIRGPSGGLLKDFTTNDYYRVLPDGSPFENLQPALPTAVRGTQAFFGIATTIGSSINLLMNKGKAFMLASPQLSARSGGSAKFLVGGEVPIPIPQGFGQVTVDFKEYGIKLDIEPVVNSNDEISTTFMAEVSRIDPSVMVQGVPGFTTRRTSSEINVRAGETIVVSGLVDSSAAKSAEKFPILGDIPILGKLFRSDGFRGNRTELVMFVTPRVISPESQENIDALERGNSIQERGKEAMSRRNKEFVQ